MIPKLKNLKMKINNFKNFNNRQTWSTFKKFWYDRQNFEKVLVQQAKFLKSCGKTDRTFDKF